MRVTLEFLLDSRLAEEEGSGAEEGTGMGRLCICSPPVRRRLQGFIWEMLLPKGWRRAYLYVPV